MCPFEHKRDIHDVVCALKRYLILLRIFCGGGSRDTNLDFIIIILSRHDGSFNMMGSSRESNKKELNSGQIFKERTNRCPDRCNVGRGEENAKVKHDCEFWAD